MRIRFSKYVDCELRDGAPRSLKRSAIIIFFLLAIVILSGCHHGNSASQTRNPINTEVNIKLQEFLYGIWESDPIPFDKMRYDPDSGKTTTSVIKNKKRYLFMPGGRGYTLRSDGETMTPFDWKVVKENTLSYQAYDDEGQASAAIRLEFKLKNDTMLYNGEFFEAKNKLRRVSKNSERYSK